MEYKKIKTFILGILILLVGVGIGYSLNLKDEPASTNYSANPAYEYMVSGAAWQMSGEAHALMLQAFHLAEENVDEMVLKANLNEDGYHWLEGKLYKDNHRVAVVCDIDDTLVDGVHYTANIVGKDGEWNNKAFTDFVLSEGCTALPGAVSFTNYCVDQGIALFYVTNRYDQAYKVSESGYAGQEGYKKVDGSVIGSSTYDVFGKTMYDITMESMAKLGFPTNDPKNDNYHEDAILIVNDTKLNGSSKKWVRDGIKEGGSLKTGERSYESNTYPESIDLESHHIAMLVGDDLNDISQIFSDSEDAITRIETVLEMSDKWGSEWIVLPNVVYGSAQNFASAYGYTQLFDAFDYTKEDNKNWELYQ